ncbi:conserved hypothetical protein [Mesorhizobium metallidurans STM 2683]|uniref:DUF559 domain-containing protein n=1 Tax=Mesorhizobium metallidurans STM 2683 TaxID=1297569 RepID=M5F6J1_9HYPH|nr:conserved hypothetical protein [Mesorhizobium metallidurans STM 2683]
MTICINLMNSRPPLRRASLDTSPPIDGVEEGREIIPAGALLLPPEGGEVAPRSSDGVGEAVRETRSRRKIGTTQRARKLRQAGNQAKALLWLELKARKLGGYRFTRQFSIGPFFADFACREKWLVVEVDGHQHADSSYDRRRDDFMRAQGYSILRLWSHDVLKHRTSVCETILATLDGRLAENIAVSDLRFVFTSRSLDSISSKTDLSL